MGPTKAMKAPSPCPRPHRRIRQEQIIADALVDVASELRLTDPGAHVYNPQRPRGEHRRPGQLIDRTLLKGQTLRYALSASFKAPWDATPTVEIDMEFRHAAVCAFFRLKIGERRAGVEIVDILFEERGSTISPRPNAFPPPSRARGFKSRSEASPVQVPSRRIDLNPLHEWRPFVVDLPL